MAMEEVLLTPAQVAEKVQVHERTVLRWLSSGKLKGIKLERFWRIKSDDLEIFLMQHAVNTKK